MLRPRIIVSLLLENGDLIKTVKFNRSKYIGDPINAVRIFNEKEVDELIVLDIGASRDGREPDYDLIAKLAAECRMPFCYGGGVKEVAQIERIISSGVEKVALSSAVVENPNLVAAAAEKVGGQSIVAVLDVKKHGPGGRYEVFIHRAQKATGLEAVAFAQRIEQLGAGEVVINSIDRDGTMEGYDMALASQFKGALGIPLTFLGGAGSLTHICDLIHFFGTIGAAAGSVFVFKGAYRAVLINYPDSAEKDALFARAQN